MLRMLHVLGSAMLSGKLLLLLQAAQHRWRRRLEPRQPSPLARLFQGSRPQPAAGRQTAWQPCRQSRGRE
jgi:hypothetical protein